ncbi:MAG: hypothetical protein U1E31_00465 [Rickettsiales bacterium]
MSNENSIFNFLQNKDQYNNIDFCQNNKLSNRLNSKTTYSILENSIKDNSKNIKKIK